MKNLDIKSLLLGIGLGIIITSAAAMIYNAGNAEKPAASAVSGVANEKTGGIFINGSGGNSSAQPQTTEDEQKGPVAK